MNPTAAKFISSFHNLSGTTIDERKREFSLLLHQHSFLTQTEDLNVVIENLKPESHLERIFWVELLIRFKRFNELLVEFKSGNEIVVSKISKHHWFFEKYFSELQPETFVNNVLPTMSYVLRLKIVKKLMLSEEQTDRVFDAIRHKYGLLLATSVLHKCSATKIRDVLQNNSVRLTPRQLKCIFDKQPDLIPLYIEERRKLLGDTFFMNFNPVFVYIAQKNPDLFCLLREKYKFNTRLGNRTTKRLVQVKKDAIVAKPKKYFDCLQTNSLVHELRDDLKSVCVQLFPDKIANLYLTDVKKLVKHCPKKNRFTLYKTAFDEVYFHKFGHETDSITEEILQLIYDNDEREYWAQIKYQECNDENFLSYYKAGSCFHMLLPKLNHSTTEQRILYIRIMTRSCIYSRDLDCFRELAKLVVERFRNDIKATYSFVNCFDKPYLGLLADLSDELWEIVKNITLKVVADYSQLDLHSHFIMSRYFEYLQKNNKPVKDVVYKIPTSIVKGLLYLPHDYGRKIQKVLLVELLLAEYKKPGDKFETAQFALELAYLCAKYNRENRKDSLANDIWQNGRLIELCRYALSIKDQYLSYIWDVLCSHDSPKEIEEFYPLVFDFESTSATYESSRDFMWFLKHKPHVIMDNSEPFLDYIFNVREANNWKFWNTVKKYSHLGLTQKVVDHYLKRLNEKDYDLFKKQSLIKPLSILVPAEEFVELAQSYKPVSSKAPDLSDGIYRIQCKITHNLKHLRDPELILPTALDFCKGDYLRFSLRPIYSAIYRTISEDKTIPYLNQLQNTEAISVKKHCLSLSCAVLDTEKGLNQLKMSTIFSPLPAVKYFRNNPSQESWDVAKHRLQKINLDGVNLLKVALKIVVPLGYKAKYQEVLWEVINSMEQISVKLQLITQISFSSYNVAAEIVRSLFLKADHEEVDQFVANFMCKNDHLARFDLLDRAMREFRATSWNVPETDLKIRKRLINFVRVLFEVFMKNDETNVERQREEALKIAAAFNRNFTYLEAFEEYVLISLLKLKKLPVADVARSVLELSRQLVKTEVFGNQGNAIVFVLAGQINWAVPHLFKQEVLKFELCHRMLELSQSVEDDLLVIKLLPSYVPEKVEGMKFYRNVVTKLREKNDNIVNLHLNSKLSNQDSCEPVIS